MILPMVVLQVEGPAGVPVIISSNLPEDQECYAYNLVPLRGGYWVWDDPWWRRPTPEEYQQLQITPRLSHYTFRTTWSAEDRKFVGLCSEMPSLSWLDPDESKALEGIQQLVRETVGAYYEIVCSTNKAGTTYSRAPEGSHRMFLATPGCWPDLNQLQRDSVCRLVWAKQSGAFLVRNTDDSWTHTLPCDPGYDVQVSFETEDD